jgi:hypothetical protein
MQQPHRGDGDKLKPYIHNVSGCRVQSRRSKKEETGKTKTCEGYYHRLCILSLLGFCYHNVFSVDIRYMVTKGSNKRVRLRVRNWPACKSNSTLQWSQSTWKKHHPWSQITAIKKGCTARIPEAIQSTQSVVLAYQFQLLHCGTVLSFGATWRPGRILAHIHIAIITHRTHRLQPLRDRSSPLPLTNLAPPLSVYVCLGRYVFPRRPVLSAGYVFPNRPVLITG